MNVRLFNLPGRRCHARTVLYFTGSLLLLLVCNTIFAQDSSKTHPAIDSGWIEKFNDRIVLKLTLENDAAIYSVENESFRYVFHANPSELLRAYVSYRIISFYLTYTPHFLPGNNDDAEKGKSKSFGFGFNYNSKQWFTSLSISGTRGYYLQNTSDYRPGWHTGDPYIQIPKLRTTVLEGSTGYNTNPHLSLTAVYAQTERQLKSAGAFIPSLSYSYYIINNKDTGFTQKANNFQVLLGAGYHHTLVLAKTLYVFGSFIPSFGYVYTRLLTRLPQGNSVTHFKSPIYQWDARAGFGYNSHRFFMGSYITATSSTNSQGLLTAVNRSGRVFLQLFAGYRLTAPKVLKKNYDQIF